MIELGLHEQRGGGLAAALRPVVDRALAMLGEAIHLGDDGAERREALAEIDSCRQLLADAPDPGRIEEVSHRLFTTCETTLHALVSQRCARQAEIQALIALVREAVTTIAGDNRTFDASLDQSTARFDALSACNDLRQLKDRLAAEVTVLKGCAAARQKSWLATVAVFEDRVASLEKQLVTTRRDAALDSLTRVANRGTFDRSCVSWLEGERAQFVLALLDLDDFKRINDVHGHSAGDRVLLVLAQALKTSVRSSDLVSRFGGDEFAVLASGVTLRQAERRMMVVAAQLAKESILPGEENRVTVSCGIAEFSAGDTVDSLMRRADQALQDAKQRGKNRVSVREQPFIRDLLAR